MASELSKRLRDSGNQAYQQGSADSLAPVVRSGRLLKACKLYVQALDASRREDERAKCCKNLGAVHWKHAKLTLEISDDGKSSLLQDRPPAFDVERSIEYYLAALRHGRAARLSDEWRQNIESSLEEIARHIVDGEGLLIDKPEFVANVSNLFVPELASASSWKSQAWAIIQLGLAHNLLDKAVRELRKKEPNGSVPYRQSLSLLHRCYGPIEEAQKHGRPDFMEEVESLKSSVESCKSTCESIQMREAGKRILEESSSMKDRSSKHDKVIAALDKFKEAAVIARGVDAESEAEALASVGDVYKEIFNKDQRAHPYYDMAVLLAQNSDAMRSAKWYERAKVALGMFFKKRDGGEGSDPDDILPEVKADVDKIEAEYKKSKTEDFLTYLYAEHPPRGNNATLVDLNGGANTRLALRKAIQHYHPDHNAVTDDPCWILLCGEITKLLLEKLRLYQQ